MSSGVCCGGRNRRRAIVVKTLPDCIVNGIGTRPMTWVEKRAEVTAGMVTDCGGSTCPDAIVGRRRQVSWDVGGFEVGEIGFAAHV